MKTPLASCVLVATALLCASTAWAGEPAPGEPGAGAPQESGPGDPPARAAAPAAPVLLIEAESAEPTADWQAEAHPLGTPPAAGHGAARKPARTGRSLRWRGGTSLQPDPKAALSYSVELPRGGRWALRLRHSTTLPPGRTSAALWVAVDDGPWQSVSFAPTRGWSWTSARGSLQFDLPAGTHTLRVGGHTPGLALDRLLLQALPAAPDEAESAG